MIISSLGSNGGLNISNRVVYCNCYQAQYNKSTPVLNIVLPTNYINDTKFIVVDFQQAHSNYNSIYLLYKSVQMVFTKGVNCSTNVMLGLWGTTSQGTNTTYNNIVRPVTYTASTNKISIVLQDNLSIFVNLICLG